MAHNQRANQLSRGHFCRPKRLEWINHLFYGLERQNNSLGHLTERMRIFI